MPRTIVAEQAPSAKPIGISFILTNNWESLIDAPQYDVPKVGFGAERELAPGVVEIASSILLVNTSDNEDVSAAVKIVRDNGDETYIMPSIKIPTKDTIAAPAQGQFLLTGDEIQVISSENNIIHATLSVTEGQAEEEITNVD